jgi:hypothetical protein
MRQRLASNPIVIAVELRVATKSRLRVFLKSEIGASQLRAAAATTSTADK